MTTEVRTLQQGQLLSDAYKIVHNHNVHHVPILDGTTLVGIVSSTDLIKLSMSAQGYDSDQMWSYIDSQYELKSIMTENPHSLDEGSAVRDAAQTLALSSYHSLPVTNNDGNLVGIVTSTDLIRYLCDQY